MTTTTTILTVDEVETMFGGVAAREYAGAPDYSLAQLSDKLRTLPGLTDRELHQFAQTAIYDSSFWNGYRGNHEDAHCLCSAVYDECLRRGLTEHPDPCRASGHRYQRAYNETVRNAGHSGMATPLSECTCPTPEA